VPQAPQFCLSIWRFTHALGQTVRPAAQVVQPVPRQAAPVAQSVFAVQVVPQATTPQAKGLQTCVDAAGQLPAPSHVAAFVAVPLVQLAVRQDVVALRNRHAPLPSHVPSCPQVVVSTAHFPLEEPPDKIGLHRPFAAPVSAFAHERQVPVQALSQQIPPTHEACTHSLLPTHVEPSIFFAAQVCVVVVAQ
jgi:hypothetical protein